MWHIRSIVRAGFKISKGKGKVITIPIPRPSMGTLRTLHQEIIIPREPGAVVLNHQEGRTMLILRDTRVKGQIMTPTSRIGVGLPLETKINLDLNHQQEGSPQVAILENVGLVANMAICGRIVPILVTKLIGK